MLPTRYFHVTMTVPEELREVLRANRRKPWKWTSSADVAAEFATSPSHFCVLPMRFDFCASPSTLGRNRAVQSMVIRAERGDRCRGSFRSHRCTYSRAELMNTAPSRSSGGRVEARLQELEMLRISEIQIVPKDQRGHSTQALKNLSCVVEPTHMRVARDEQSIWVRKIRR
jgi:hypothetical protein